MGPAKGSRMATKITIKEYKEEQHHEDPTTSNKAKLKKRKMSDLGAKWSKDELFCFYDAYRRHGKNWKKVSTAVGSKSADMVEALYNVHQTFLSLPERQGTAMGFIALVTGHHSVLDEFPNHKESYRTVRTSGRTQNRGEAAQQKEKESSYPNHSYYVKRVLGSSSRKRFSGELIRDIPSHPVGRRTPRVPVMGPADVNATDDITPEIKNTVSTKMVNEEINNDGSIIAMNGCSPDGSSGITEASRVVQGQTSLEIKGTGNTGISQTQDHLKKRGIEQSMDKDKISKDELDHETMTVARDGNNVAGCQGVIESFSADEMLVLDVLESLVTVTSKASEPNITSGTLGKNSSHKNEEGPSTVGQSKKGKKRVSDCSASKPRKKRKKSLDEEIPVEEQNISANNLALPEACQADTTEQPPSLNAGSERGGIELPESDASISAEACPDVPMEIKPEINISRRSKRKSEIKCIKKYVTCYNDSDNLQAKKLMHCLSSESLRRWCTYEWFYSAVDYPWFMNNEFVSYLNFANLSHLSRLTRFEWSTIRSSLGKPRRFSDHFLEVEKEKLEDYRENVRKYYAQLIDGYLDSLPADLARPFSVGQQLIVRHPSTRELCDGKVVTVEPDCYKVQFDNPDLGLSVVKDTDCMPVNWSDNLPDDLKSVTKRRSSIPNYAHEKPNTEHIPKHTQKEGWEHATISEQSRNQQITSDDWHKVESTAYSERLLQMSSIGRCAPLHSLQSADDSVLFRGRSNTHSGHSDERDSYINAFVQSSLSQAKQMVGQVTQEISENGNSFQEEEVCTSNQATNHMSHLAKAALDDAQLPSELISICVATVLAIQQLSESRLPPANVVGVLELVSSMLRPICSENVTIYNDIENSLCIIKNQLLALMPPASRNGTGFATVNCDFGGFYGSTC